MELSPVLVIGVVLLVVVAGLAVWQRSQQIDRTVAPGRSLGGAAPVPNVAAAPTTPPSEDEHLVTVSDPLLGDITFADGLWVTDDDPEFAGTTVVVEVSGASTGLTEAQRALLSAALSAQHDLDTRARAAIQQELDRQGIGPSEMEAYEIAVRAGDDGRPVGFLWYDVKEADREMGVSSTDDWRTLKVETFA